MKKKFLACLMACMCAVFSASATSDYDGEIMDWFYVENGVIHTIVNIENVEGIVITQPESETPVELKDGVNTLMVPLSKHTYTVSAKQGFDVTVKIGDKTYTCDDAPVIVDCAKPAPVFISAKSNTSAGITEINENKGDIKYFDLNGLLIRNPEAGKIYIRVSGSEVRKVIF